MPESETPDNAAPATLPGVFPETRWTLVLRAAAEGGSPSSRRALEDLCRAYWRPVYAVSRRSGLSHEDAEDLTQTFFADLIATNSMNRVTPEAGRLRWFLQASLRHHLNHLREKACAAKRGGGKEPLRLDMSGAEQYYHLIPADQLTPETLYDRHWMLALMDRALATLATEQAQRGRGEFFATVRPAITAEGANISYAEIGRLHQLSEAAVKMAVMRLRERLREIMRTEISETVASPQDVDDEIRHLFAAFS
ncbi:MAG TPA: sigma-70 family RNA polymerase sigma factor [Verrucomicrobiales bacterium]|jgi:RNA polymerase sigma-70 factor (ECF subfamily)|nr:sigma-70 family RNA polymerase sigma factor [Verrucomicrobiales bacterium]